MNFSFVTILKKVREIKFSSQRKETLTHPHRDWGLILFVFLLVVILFISWGTYFFWKIKSGELFMLEAGPSVREQTIDRKELKEVTSFYEEREGIYKGFFGESPTLPNPVK